MSIEGDWYYVKSGETVGPVSREALQEAISGSDGPKTLVWGPGVAEWTQARHVAGVGVGKARAGPPARAEGPRCVDEIAGEVCG